MRDDKQKYSIHFGLSTAFIVVLTVLVLVVMGITYWRFNDSLFSLSKALVDNSAKLTQDEFSDYIYPLIHQTELTTTLINNGVLDPTDKPQMLKYERALLSSNQQFVSTFWADDEGGFIGVNRRDTDEFYILQATPQGDSVKKETQLEDSNGNVLATGEIDTSSFDPRTRPWYQKAVAEKKMIWSGVYHFSAVFTNQKDVLGLTAAEPLYDSKGGLLGVFGIAIKLEYLINYLKKLKISEHSVVLLINQQGQLIAAPNVEDPLSLNDDPTALNKAFPWLSEAYQTFQNTQQDFFTTSVNNADYLVSIDKIQHIVGETWYIVIAAPRSDFMAEIYRVNVIVFLLYLLVLVIGAILINIFSKRVATPMRSLLDYTKKIKHLQFNEALENTSRIKEIGELQTSLNDMVEGLRLFQKFAQIDVIKKLVEENKNILYTGQVQSLTLFVSNIENFNAASRAVSTSHLLEKLANYFDINTQIIKDHQGTIDKYMGDSVLAFWGAPEFDDQQVLHACQAALLIKNTLNDQNNLWLNDMALLPLTQIGLHTGDVIVGNIGSTAYVNYTVLGEAMSLTAYLQQLNKVYGTTIIVSQGIYEQSYEDFTYRFLDEIILPQQAESLKIYELVADAYHQENAKFVNYQQQFELAFTAYKTAQWDVAIERFQHLYKTYDNDSVAAVFIQRCQHLQQHPPQDWQGIWVFKKEWQSL